jgi:hypothetical protein
LFDTAADAPSHAGPLRLRMVFSISGLSSLNSGTGVVKP